MEPNIERIRALPPTVTRTRPLVAVLSAYPLFVEALTAAFAGIADVQAIDAGSPAALGLVRAFRPDALITDRELTEFLEMPRASFRIDLVSELFSSREGDDWVPVHLEPSPEIIRNLVVAALYGGESQ